MPARKMNKRLLKQAQRKADRRTGEGFENYRNRVDSFELKPINGRSAMHWVADYTKNGRKMVELSHASSQREYERIVFREAAGRATR